MNFLNLKCLMRFKLCTIRFPLVERVIILTDFFMTPLTSHLAARCYSLARTREYNLKEKRFNDESSKLRMIFIVYWRREREIRKSQSKAAESSHGAKTHRSRSSIRSSWHERMNFIFQNLVAFFRVSSSRSLPSLYFWKKLFFIRRWDDIFVCSAQVGRRAAMLVFFSTNKRKS